jgi:uncharacterized membrane protein
MVNDKLGVPECERPSFEEIEERYQSFRASCAPLTETQRANNSVKGCTVPADGISKRSVIKVVEYDKVPETTKASDSQMQSIPKSDDYFILNKKKTAIVVLLLLIFIIITVIMKNKVKK